MILLKGGGKSCPATSSTCITQQLFSGLAGKSNTVELLQLSSLILESIMYCLQEKQRANTPKRDGRAVERQRCLHPSGCNM